MDALDQEILSILQDDGRATMTDVAARVGLSLSACHRRVRDLEGAGVIAGYRAVISPGAVGLGFEALVFVTMDRSDVSTVAEFERAVAELPGLVSAHRLFGEPDYMLRILTADIAGYQALYDDQLGSLPGVRRCTSTMVMKSIGADGTVPLTASTEGKHDDR